jgi:hypothetical protein
LLKEVGGLEDAMSFVSTKSFAVMALMKDSVAMFETTGPSP